MRGGPTTRTGKAQPATKAGKGCATPRVRGIPEGGGKGNPLACSKWSVPRMSRDKKACRSSSPLKSDLRTYREGG
jgi:hypothetical protein